MYAHTHTNTHTHLHTYIHTYIHKQKRSQHFRTGYGVEAGGDCWGWVWGQGGNLGGNPGALIMRMLISSEFQGPTKRPTNSAEDSRLTQASIKPLPSAPTKSYTWRNFYKKNRLEYNFY